MIKENKKMKKKLRMVYTSELKLLEDRYEKMAKDGWMIDMVTGTLDKFVKCDPKELDFAVTLFQPDLPIDYPDKGKHVMQQEFCEDAGWHYVCHNNLFHVYCKPKDSDVISIHTDPQSEFKSLLKGFLRSEVLLLILLLIQIFQLTMQVKFLNYRDFLNSQINFNFITPLVLSIMLLICSIPSSIFIIRNYLRVKRGENILYDSLKKIKQNNRIRFSSMLICFVYLISTYAGIIFKGVPSYILITVILTQTGMVGIFYLFFLKVKKIKHSRLVNTIILVTLFFIVWIGSVAILFSVIGNHVDFKRPVYDMPDVAILTFEKLGYEYKFEPEVSDVESTFLVPQSFNYLAQYMGDNDSVYLNVEYIETRFEWVQEMMLPLILEYEYRHPDESPLVVSEAFIANDNVRLYKVRYDQSKILIINDQIIYIVTMNKPIKGALLDMVVFGLLETN